jgi:outer membrane protein assembly factor BamB
LQALDVQQPNITLWEFQTAGSIYSQPTIDPNTGRIYFGSSDKHLYALSGEGIFLWRVAVNDNMAAQPLIAHDQVVIAIEDGTIYAINKTSGAEDWRLSMGSASIAAPTHFATAQSGLIVVGSDEGLLQALESTTGTVAWEVTLEGAIQAPLRVDNGTLYASTTAAAIHAISADGTLLWTSELVAGVLTAPVFDTNNLYIVDRQGWFYAITRAHGHIVWRSQQPDYLGPPIRLSTNEPSSDGESEYLIVASVDGTVSAFSLVGVLIKQWHVADPFTDLFTDLYAGGNHSNPSFTLGATFGGGALWLGDDQATIIRLGPPIVAP